MRFFERAKDIGTLEINPNVFKKLTAEDWKHIIAICDKILETYYSRLEKMDKGAGERQKEHIFPVARQPYGRKQKQENLAAAAEKKTPYGRK